MSKYRTEPIQTTGMPPGVPYIVANEAAERFSYYGMRCILVIFMTKYLHDSHGQLAVMNDLDAKHWYHLFIASVYIFPIAGAILADAFLGKYMTILSLSIVYCLGHLALAIDSTRVGLAIGLGLIAIGSGGIKSCVSANVGDQFSATNGHLISKVFAWFYFSINLGSAVSTLLIPVLLNRYGPHVAFGTPGLLMLLATIFFWLGRNKYAHIPPAGSDFFRETFSAEGLKTIGKLAVIYIFIAMFWSLYDQSSSAWVLQADKMDRKVFGYEVLSAQIQAINPLLILVYIPLFTYIIYPVINKFFPLTPLRKISIGMFVTAASFVVPAHIESMINAGQTPHIIWQFYAYTLLIAGEILVSITVLEFSYTQAPKRMKSLIMGLFLASVTLGNVFTAEVNSFMKIPSIGEKLAGPNYYLFFAGMMFLTAILFVFVALLYKEKTYLQGPEGSPAGSK
jgi:proton-dependent oligopeptide transporter, POT family